MNDEQEAVFLLDELFFSRTNSKGHIQSGNSVFQRVSGYEWEELLHKPHNIIRHPDMPKEVFHFFWKELLEERPVGAYVKNMSKDRSFYWVYALALPVRDGYLSVRLKPSTETLSVVTQEYHQLRKEEKLLSPEESHKLLLQKIKILGFSSYQDFMTDALINELSSRHFNLHGVNLQELSKLKELNAINKSICRIPQEILTAYSAIVWTPLNLEISALKLGESGRSVGVVASTYQKMIIDIERQIHAFEKSSAIVEEEIKESAFLKASNLLISEVMAFFEKEEGNDFIDAERELQYLRFLKKNYQSKSDETFNRAYRTLSQFSAICKELNSLIIGLEVIRISGKMEIGRLHSSGDLNNLLQELFVFQNLVNKNLNELQGLVKSALGRFSH